MSKLGRPANRQPATAYDMRRANLLVKLIARGAPIGTYRLVASEWGIEWRGDLADMQRRMAIHALEHYLDQIKET